MCAIAGVIGLPFDENVAHSMLETMFRRGPDGTGVHFDEQCCLLHSRLAVIDPAAGQQPMHLQWEDEGYTVVYNGELYNARELRTELERLGHTFVTNCDTEVVLHACAQWSEQCLHRMNGIFAFALWEKNKKRLFLARDRMGVKPLFYKLHSSGFLFASEIKTILTYPTVKAQLDADGVGQLLLLGPGRTPGSGVFRGILELEPGCCGYYEQGRWRWKRYWKLTDREHTDSFADTVDTVRYLVTDAIKRQMVSDVPVGAFLSGGLDSSLICAVCAQEIRKDGQKLPAFSVDYENNDKYFVPGKFQPNSDNSFIGIMKDYLGCDHYRTVLTPEDLVEALEDATCARDLPGMADVDFSLLAFCGHIRERVKVALSGECADEIFGGYPWYRDPEVRALEGFPWAQNTKHRANFLNGHYREILNPEAFVMDRYWDTLAQCDILPETDPKEQRMKQMVNLNHRWFMQTLLDRKDRMSMYHGLEVRVPFCDYRIAQYLYGVPWEYKDHGGFEKGLLRKAMEGLLPDAVLWRKKSPYPKTYDPRYMDTVSAMLRAVISSKDSPILQIVNASALEGLLTAEYVWPWYGQLMKVPQTIAYMLQINFWLEKYQVELV